MLDKYLLDLDQIKIDHTHECIVFGKVAAWFSRLAAPVMTPTITIVNMLMS